MQILRGVAFTLALAVLPALAVAKDGAPHTAGSSKASSDSGPRPTQQAQPLLRGE